MNHLLEEPASKIVESIKSQELSAEDYISRVFEQIDHVEDTVNAYITVLKNSALKSAKDLDRRIKRNKYVGRLAGCTLAVKDNMCTKGVRTTCGSKMLYNFIPPYNATVIEKIRSEDAIIAGKTNMDEFAMGSSTEHSFKGPTRNPLNKELVAGGSSGGSAAAVAASEATLALGSDTGGSIRCPAAFCSVVGLKPTYGLVSRYGLIAYANSLEQIGPIARDVRDCALLLSCIAGPDPYDSTSVAKSHNDHTRFLSDEVKGLRVGVIKQFFGEGTQDEVSKCVWNMILRLESEGALYEEVSLRSLDYALPAYYIIAMSEASSNLARFDGIRFGLRAPGVIGDWNRSFARSRQLGFGSEVKRRIILGTYALSAGYYDQYYLKAERVRTLIRRDFEEAFKRFDVLVGPTMPILPFKIGEKVDDPLAMYMCDVDSVAANLAGLPAISIPCASAKSNPVGLQIIAPSFREDLLLKAAYCFEQYCSI